MDDFNQQEQAPQPARQFQVNIYPVMYWALAFGAIAALLLFLLTLLARFVTIVWFPVFLAGLVWGGYRNYKKQKEEWSKFSGMPTRPQSAVNDFKEAARDVFQASREMLAQQQAEDAASRVEAEPEGQEFAPQTSEAFPEETSIPPEQSAPLPPEQQPRQ